MARGAPKGNNHNPKGNPSSLVPGAGQKVASQRNGIWSEEMRARLRPMVSAAIDLLGRVLEGKPMTKGNPDPTPTEVINALKLVMPYVMTELRPVIDKVLCEILAEEMARDERIPAEVITDLVGRVIDRLNSE